MVSRGFFLSHWGEEMMQQASWSVFAFAKMHGRFKCAAIVGN
jgi:hypothetical protein